MNRFITFLKMTLFIFLATVLGTPVQAAPVVAQEEPARVREKYVMALIAQSVKQEVNTYPLKDVKADFLKLTTPEYPDTISGAECIALLEKHSALAKQMRMRLEQAHRRVRTLAELSLDALVNTIYKQNKGVIGKFLNRDKIKTTLMTAKYTHLLERIAAEYQLKYGESLDFKTLQFAPEDIPVYGVSVADLNKAGKLPYPLYESLEMLEGMVRTKICSWQGLHINSLMGLGSYHKGSTERNCRYHFNNNELSSLEGLPSSSRIEALDFSNNKITTAGLGDGNIIFPKNIIRLSLRNNLIEDVPQSIIDQWNNLVLLNEYSALSMITATNAVIDLRGNPLNEETKERLKILGKRVLYDKTPTPGVAEKVKKFVSRVTSSRGA
jgi:hypothetical protein